MGTTNFQVTRVTLFSVTCLISEHVARLVHYGDSSKVPSWSWRIETELTSPLQEEIGIETDEDVGCNITDYMSLGAKKQKK